MGFHANRVAAILVIIVFCLIAAYGYMQFKSENSSSSKSMPAITTNSSQIPKQYENLTIPYLRQQTYASKIGSLEEDYSGDNYTAYLTSYTSAGYKINALLTKPTGDMPKGGWPAIVFIHGYIPPTQYQTDGQAYSRYVDYLASQGFVIFKIDLRGNGQSEGRPGGGYFGSDYVTDALNAYAALQAADFINPNKIGLWGHSMAGNIVLRSLAVKETIPAAVIWAGAVYSYTDQAKYGIQDPSFDRSQVTARNSSRRKLFETIGSPSAKSVFWQQVAPTSYLNDIKTAIEIHHAQDDNVVNIGYSRDLVALLDKTSVPHEYYEYPTGGHNITDPSFSLAMQRTAEFFKKYLE